MPGPYKETVDFDHPPQKVFEMLVSVLNRLGYEIESWDEGMRALIAHRGARMAWDWFFWFRLAGDTRVAARVDAHGDGSRLTIESAPHYLSPSGRPGVYRGYARRIVKTLTKALES